MPMYVYNCPKCGDYREMIRRIVERHDPVMCLGCDGDMELVIAAPSLSIWDETRKFPNLSPRGDGSMTFKSRAAYESHLKENGIGELGVKAKIKRAHGNTEIAKWR